MTRHQGQDKTLTMRGQDDDMMLTEMSRQQQDETLITRDQGDNETSTTGHQRKIRERPKRDQREIRER